MLEEIIKSSAGLIWTVARMFYGIDKNDLYQAGVLGVIKAYRNYDKNSSTKFSTYAYKYIYGEMYTLASNKEIKLNKDITKALKLIEKGRGRLAQDLMRMPTNGELAEYLEMDIGKLEVILQYASSFVSLDNLEEDKRDLHEVISASESVSNIDKMALKEGISTLNQVEQDIIKSRYYEDLTQSETARKLGITQVMVSRYEQKSLKKMREFMYM